jgi:NAD(P)-dependent dehydrogenase (short-subunit alcohol dehydrogenase family)
MASLSRVALVTGGARRIGRAIVEDLAANGWAVAIHYNRSRDDAEACAAQIRRAGGAAALVNGDFADFECLKRIVDQVSEALGPPTLLVNNASIFEKDTVGALDRDLWHRQMTINLAAPVFLAEAFAAGIPDGVEGNVVNLLDQRIWKPTPRYFSYQVSKSALFTATQTLAQALAPRVRVNGIAPGPTLPSATQTPERFRQQTEHILLRRAPDLADFGRTVRYLVENRSITGQVIALDAGQHLGWQTPDIAALNNG